MECNTFIEGSFSYPKIWKYNYPALLDKNGYIKYGDVIKKDDDGIYFLEKKSGLFHSPDTLFFTYDKFKTVVDYKNKCTFGEIPEGYFIELSELSISLKSLDTLVDPPYYFALELEPNKSFSYCAKPGNYVCENVSFNFSDGMIEAFQVPNIKLEVKKNTVTNIGSIRFLEQWEDTTGAIIISFATKNDDGLGMAAFLGGAIGAAIYAAATQPSEADAYFALEVTKDTSSVKQKDLEFISIPLRVR